MIRIAFIKYGGLAAGGTERWLQYIAKHLPKDLFAIDYFYCDASPYVGSDYRHPGTDPLRLAYLNSSNIKLIEFKVGLKDVTKPTHDWLDTNFWDYFEPNNYQIVQAAKAGPAEYPFDRIKIPIVETVTLAAGTDLSPNIAWSFLLSQSQRASWIQSGGKVSRSSVIPIPVFAPEHNENFRHELGIPSGALVTGFHQADRQGIFSNKPLEAFKELESESHYFVLLGGSEQYREQAKELDLKNFRHIPLNSDEFVITKFLNTLNFFSHGRKDGETFGTVFAEAMIHGLPCISHTSDFGPNGHIETIGPAGYVEENLVGYTARMRSLFNDSQLREKLSRDAKNHSTNFYSIDEAVSKVKSLYGSIANKKSIGISKSNKHFDYGYSNLGFLQAGDLDEKSSSANHILSGEVPEFFNLKIADFFASRVKLYLDIGADIGLYCLRAARVNPDLKILAFEPDVSSYHFLCLSTKLNKWEGRLKTFNCTIGNFQINDDLNLSEKEVSLIMEFLSSESNDGGDEFVKTLALDSIIDKSIQVPSFVRINVEGSELFVLEGATNFLNKNRPPMLIKINAENDGENNSNPNFRKTMDFISQSRYKIYISDGKNRISRFRRTEITTNRAFMFLCLPQESHLKEIATLKIYLIQQQVFIFFKAIQVFSSRILTLYRNIGFLRATKLIGLKTHISLRKKLLAD